VENISTDITCEAPGDAPVAPLNYQFCQDSMSEASTSVLQLIKRYNQVRFTFTVAGDDYLSIIPWGLSAKRYFSATLTGPSQLDDPLLSFVLAPFAFYRGSMRYRMNPPWQNSDVGNYYMVRSDGIGNSATLYAASGTSSAGTAFPYSCALTGTLKPQGLPPACNNPGFGGLSASLPYQNVYRMCPIQFAYQTSTTSDFFTPRVNLAIYLGTNRDRPIFRAVGDDFQALFWVGVPRMAS